jgi:hypothetical protein
MQTKCEEELFVHKIAESPRRETQRARNGIPNKKWTKNISHLSYIF